MESPKTRAEKTEPSCADWLPIVGPYLPRQLVDAVFLSRIEAVARHLPDDGINVIELRLGRGCPRTDFSIGLTKADQAQRLLGQGCFTHLTSLLESWASPRLAPVESLWLEFDLAADPSPGPPSPVLCAKLRGRPDMDWLLSELFPALCGKALGPVQERLARRAIEALPASARVLYAFSLRSRGTHAIRLELFDLPLTAMASYFEGFAPFLIPEIERLSPWLEDCHRPHLSFDIGDEVSPRLGLEGSFEHQPQRDSRWRRRFDGFVEQGWCTPEKHDAILSWPGWDSPRTMPEIWPEARRLPGAFCARALSHFKLTGERGRVEAKVYLLFQYVEKRQAVEKRQRQTLDNPSSSPS